jgi:hypothetical protein
MHQQTLLPSAGNETRRASLGRACSTLFVFACLALPFPALSAGVAQNPSTMEFASGGLIDMELHAGTVEVVGSADNRIAVDYTTGDDEERTVKIDLHKTSDGEATVRVIGPSNHFHYRVQIPERSNVHIRMTAGNLDVSRIRGDHDIALRAGNLVLRIGDPDSYGIVHASVTAGEIDARPWRVEKGGLARSFDREGKGSLKLKARVIAGNLNIRAGD